MAGTLRCIAAFRLDPVRSAWLALSICFRKTRRASITRLQRA
jgi:hypothetical protein